MTLIRDVYNILNETIEKEDFHSKSLFIDGRLKTMKYSLISLIILTSSWSYSENSMIFILLPSCKHIESKAGEEHILVSKVTSMHLVCEKKSKDTFNCEFYGGDDDDEIMVNKIREVELKSVSNKPLVLTDKDKDIELILHEDKNSLFRERIEVGNHKIIASKICTGSSANIKSKPKKKPKKKNDNDKTLISLNHK